MGYNADKNRYDKMTVPALRKQRFKIADGFAWLVAQFRAD